MLDESTKTQLRLRRQFILCASEPSFASRFTSWKKLLVGSYVLYAHPELGADQASFGGVEATLLGYLIDPRDSHLTNRDIVVELLRTARTPDDIFELTKPFGGRWILIIRMDDCTIMFNDPVGLRQVFYTTDLIAPTMCASQPGIIAEALNLKLDDQVLEQFLKPQMETVREYWWPGDSSPYKEIKHLTPNHYLDLNAKSVHRFWPRAGLPSINLSDGVSDTCELLKGLLLAAYNRFPIALPLSAGIDSRTLFAASREIQSKLYYYTLIFYSSMSRRHPDITVPSRLLKRLGLKHHIIESQYCVDSDFEKIFFENVPFARKVLAPVAYGLFKSFPSDRVAVKGHCGELARCFFYEDGYPEAKVTATSLAKLSGMGSSSFAREQLATWLREAEAVEENFGVSVLDLFYWEQRLGNWLATGQLELDIAQEIFTPMNCRQILEIFLSIDDRYRRKPDHQFFFDVIRELWPEVLLTPINPQPVLGPKLRSFAEKFTRKVRIYHMLRPIYRSLTALWRE